ETPYAAAKGGIIGFTKSLAREGARHKITVNCVCPGPTDTPLFHANPERMREALLRAIPFRRLAKPEEIAEAILYFVGPTSDYVTGQILSVSGGLTMAGGAAGRLALAPRGIVQFDICLPQDRIAASHAPWPHPLPPHRPP